MKIGYCNDFTGACRKVRILDETVTGKYLIEVISLGTITSVPKEEVKDIEDESA